jgi:hypothetical protein
VTTPPLVRGHRRALIRALFKARSLTTGVPSSMRRHLALQQRSPAGPSRWQADRARRSHGEAIQLGIVSVIECEVLVHGPHRC